MAMQTTDTSKQLGGQPAPKQLAELESPVITRVHERRAIAVPENPVRYEELSPRGLRSMAMFRASAAPGQSTGTRPLAHGGDEVLLMISGTMEALIGGVTYRVGAGDTLYIPRGEGHVITNVGTEPAEAIFVLSPPAY